ncbi:hypothetical protein ACOSP7_029050 [Xanthoceras sorbifolium]
MLLSFLDRVIEVCERGLKIENSTDPGVDRIFKQSRIEHQNQELLGFLKAAYECQRSVKSAQKKAGEVVNKEVEEKEDIEVEEEVLLLERTKNPIESVVVYLTASKQKMRSYYCNEKKIKDQVDMTLKYKHFWSRTLSAEKKRSFRKVSIEDLENTL